MELTFKRKVVIALVIVAAAAFAGGAYAANQDSSATSRQAFLRDVAKRLNVTPAQLRGAFQGAFLDQLSAAVAAGKLTQAEADRIKQRVQRHGFVPGFFGGPRRGFLHRFGARGFFPGAPGGAPGARGFFPGAPGSPGPGGPGPDGPGRLAAAAKYLSLTRDQLLHQLLAGKSLAQVAQAHGKSVGGLESAMQAAIKARLDEAVKAKEITPAQESRFLAGLPARLKAEINGKLKFHAFRGSRDFDGHGSGGGPPGAPQMPPVPGGPASFTPPASPGPVY
jgi:hypothetical protein